MNRTAIGFGLAAALTLLTLLAGPHASALPQHPVALELPRGRPVAPPSGHPDNLATWLVAANGEASDERLKS